VKATRIVAGDAGVDEAVLVLIFTNHHVHGHSFFLAYTLSPLGASADAIAGRLSWR
jgi:hypothetical protein